MATSNNSVKNTVYINNSFVLDNSSSINAQNIPKPRKSTTVASSESSEDNGIVRDEKDEHEKGEQDLDLDNQNELIPRFDHENSNSNTTIVTINIAQNNQVTQLQNTLGIKTISLPNTNNSNNSSNTNQAVTTDLTNKLDSQNAVLSATINSSNTRYSQKKPLATSLSGNPSNVIRLNETVCQRTGSQTYTSSSQRTSQRNQTQTQLQSQSQTQTQTQITTIAVEQVNENQTLINYHPLNYQSATLPKDYHSNLNHHGQNQIQNQNSNFPNETPQHSHHNGISHQPHPHKPTLTNAPSATIPLNDSSINNYDPRQFQKDALQKIINKSREDFTNLIRSSLRSRSRSRSRSKSDSDAEVSEINDSKIVTKSATREIEVVSHEKVKNLVLDERIDAKVKRTKQKKKITAKKFLENSRKKISELPNFFS